MALSDAKSIPIENAIANLLGVVERLKEYKQLVLAYKDLEKDRERLCRTVLNAYEQIRRGGTPVQVDLGNLVRTALGAVPAAPAKRTVQSPRLSIDEAKMIAEHEAKLRAYQDGTLAKARAVAPVPKRALPQAPAHVTKAYTDAQQKAIIYAGDNQAKMLESPGRGGGSAGYAKMHDGDSR